MINMGYLDPIPLNPENKVGGKSNKSNPPQMSAAEEGTWFKGDATKKRIIEARTEFAADGSDVKELLRGALYNVRRNGYSAIHDTGTVPFEGTDGSYFRPGEPAEMTDLQKRAFFKHAEHDEYNRTLVSRVLRGDFIYGNASAKKHPLKRSISQIIARNRRDASKPSSRSVSAMEKRNGRDLSNADTRPAQRRVADRIADTCADFIDSKAKFQVVDYLSKTSNANRDSLEGLFASIRSASKSKSLLSREDPQQSSDKAVSRLMSGPDGVSRPGTAAVMGRSERDVQQAIGAQMSHAAEGKLMVDDKRIATPKFGVSALHKGRLVGHRAECTGKFGYVPTSEERIRDLRKMLRDFIYMKTKDLKAAWRWFDPDALGYVDVQGLYCIAQEFMIECTMEEMAALHRVLDLDGDGAISYEDFTQSMFDTAVQERDFFLVCKKPGFDIANEVMIFEDDDDGAHLGDSIRSEWAQMSIADGISDGDHPILPYDKTDVPRPPNSTSHQQARQSRPVTAATEMHEFARSTSQSRPSTGSGLLSLKQRQNQIWGDAARIAALTGGRDSVDSIKKVLDAMGPALAGDGVRQRPAEVRNNDAERPLSRAGSAASRDALVDRKPGEVPRGISAEQARQLLSRRGAAPSKDMAQRGPTMQESAPPHQPAGPWRQARNNVSSVKPEYTGRSFVVARPPAATAAAARADQHQRRLRETLNSSAKAKPAPSSLFLMNTEPLASSATYDAGKKSVGAGAGPQKAMVGAERNDRA